MKVVGIDIGTSNIGIVLVDADSGKAIVSRTEANDSFIPGAEKLQNPERTFEIVKSALDDIVKEFGPVSAIALDGQMHGIVYVDGNGTAVSPFYTWEYEGGKAEAEYLEERVGDANVGFGIVTHYHLQLSGKIPPSAVGFTSIADYVGMRLAGRRSALVGPDMAASFGCYDLEARDFRRDLLYRAGVNIRYLPEIVDRYSVIGRTAEGTPVFVALGDNQASFLGATGYEYEDTLLVNLGTAGQISFPANLICGRGENVEFRPLSQYSYLLVGASLCAGRAYGLLEGFYRSIRGSSDEECYGLMNRDAESFIEENGIDRIWKIRTTFAGRRSDKDERGVIENIDEGNFTPGAFAAGILYGIVDELHQYYLEMVKLTGRRARRLVGSGNLMRLNALVQKLTESIFSMKLELSDSLEEAAYGSALAAIRAMKEGEV